MRLRLPTLRFPSPTLDRRVRTLTRPTGRVVVCRAGKRSTPAVATNRRPARAIKKYVGRVSASAPAVATYRRPAPAIKKAAIGSLFTQRRNLIPGFPTGHIRRRFPPSRVPRRPASVWFPRSGTPRRRFPGRPPCCGQSRLRHPLHQ